MNGEEIPGGTGGGIPLVSAADQARIALALIANEAGGLALAAQYRLEAAEAHALRDRLAARAEEVFSARSETLALELALCREELAQLVRLAEARRMSAQSQWIREGMALIPATDMAGVRGLLYNMALPLARRLPEPVKVHLRRRFSRRR